MPEEYTSKSIKVLSGVEAVRKRPGMYFGEINGCAVNNAIYELIANAVDQYLAKHASKVTLTVNENVIEVTDDGAGLPFDERSPGKESESLVEYFMTNYHNSPTADGHAPHVHVVRSGLGLAAINAASEYISIESSNGKSVWKQTFGKGKILSEAIYEETCAPSGTKVQMVLDKEIFGEHLPDLLELRKSMFELAHFYPGLDVEFQEERFHSKNGLLDLAYISFDSSSLKSTPRKFFYEGKDNDVYLHIAAIGASSPQTIYRSWINGGASVEGGTHVDALDKVLKKVGWSPDIALIHVIMHNPKFASPCKDKLDCPELAGVIERLLEKALEA